MPAGAVLTGGASRRMGTHKALVEYDGVPMAARVADALCSAGCDPVVFIGDVVPGLAALGVRVLPDLAPGEGPVGGIVTALRSLEVADGVVVVVSCDLPLLTADHLGPLLERVLVGDVDVAVARTDRRQPLCAAWRQSSLASVETDFAGGERAVHRVLDRLRVAEVAVAVDAARNMNTPDDLGQ